MVNPLKALPIKKKLGPHFVATDMTVRGGGCYSVNVRPFPANHARQPMMDCQQHTGQYSIYVEFIYRLFLM